MDGFIFLEGDLSGIDSQGSLFYAWSHGQQEERRRDCESKPKRSPKKAAVKAVDDLREVKENRNETSETLAYFAKYYDQI